MKASFRTIPFVIALCLLIESCSSSGIDNRKSATAENDGRYDTEFPSKNCSKQLEEISESIKLINSVAYYRTVYFSKESCLLKSDINSDAIKKIWNAH